MQNNTITVAGEDLEVIEAALDCFDITSDACGCLNMTGTLPEHLSQPLARALRTIESEASEHGPIDAMFELFRRIGAAYAAEG